MSNKQKKEDNATVEESVKKNKNDRFGEKKKSNFQKNLTEFFEDNGENSLTSRVVSQFGRLDTKTESSLLLGKIPFGEAKARFIKPMKRKISSLKEESATFYFLDYIGKMLLATKLRVYGTLLLSFGIYSIAAGLVSSFIADQGLFGIDYTNVIVSGIVVLLSFLLIFSGGKISLRQGILESRILSTVLFSYYGVKEESLKKEYDIKPMSPLLAFIFGMLLGIASMFIPAIDLIGRIFIIIIAIIVFAVPESGVVLTFFAIPFSSVPQVIVMVSYVWTCYIFKFVLGKRTLRLSFTDGVVILFAAICLITAMIFNKSGSLAIGLIRCGFIMSFVLVSNLIRSREWIIRCKKAIYIASGIIGVWTLFEIVAKYVLSYIDANLSSVDISPVVSIIDLDINTISVFDNYQTLSVYIMMAVFFVISHYDTTSTKSHGVGPLFVFLVCSAVLILSKCWTCWIGFICGYVVYLVNKNKKSIYYILSLALLVGVAIIIIPDDIMRSAVEFIDFDVPSLSQRIEVWSGAVRMAVSNIFGMGYSQSEFEAMFREYGPSSLSGVTDSSNLYLQIIIQSGLVSLILFIMVILMVIGGYTIWTKSRKRGDDHPVKIGHAGICAMVALLVSGILDYVFYNYNLFIMFFMILGLVYSCSKILRDDSDGEEKLNETVYYFSRKESKVRDEGGDDKEQG